MGIMSALVELLDDTIRSLNGYFGKSVGSYCDLETALDKNILASRDGSLVTLLRWSGANHLIGEDEYHTLVARISSRLGPAMMNPGHVLQIVFTNEGSDESVKNTLEEEFRGLYSAADKLKLDVDDILADRFDTMAKLCSKEHCYIAVWTRPAVLNGADWKNANAKQREEIKDNKHGKRAQNYDSGARALLDTHRSFIDSLVRDFVSNGLAVSAIDKHDAARVIRQLVDPDFTSDDWMPSLAGDDPVFREADFPSKDISFLLWPPLAPQLIPREPVVRSFRTCQIGDRIWTPLVVTQAPRKTQPFSDLFQRLRASRIPWRISFTISGAGLNETSFAQMASSALTLGSHRNRTMDSAFAALKKMKEGGEPITALRICATSWAKSGQYEKLAENTSRLARAIQGWGGCDVSEVTGNAVQGVLATVPGLGLSTVAPACTPPLSEALKFLPWHRPASPWARGHVLFRSTDGKPFPYRAYSSRQDAWVTLLFSPMGGGKSVQMNSLHMGLLLDDSNDSLPLIRIMDIGPSSSGFISMAQNALPPTERHRAQHYKLKMTKEYAWNPCDTLLGQRKPLSAHRAFLVNILVLLATPLGEGQSPQDGIDGIASMAIDRAYERLSDGPSSQPRLYFSNIDRFVDEQIVKHNVKLQRGATWWEVVDAFSKLGLYRIAGIAQRYAVPTIPDIAAEARREEITAIFKGRTETHELLPDYFGRKMIEALDAYPILGAATRFDIGDSEIIALDLDEVAIKGSDQADRQTAVMYLLGLWMMSSDFFIGDDILPTISADYRPYHAERVRKLKRKKKRLAADELHRPVQAAPIAIKVIDQVVREGRKWQVEVVLASQRWEDFPNSIVQLATCFMVLKPPATGIDEMCSFFKFSTTEQYAIEHKLNGPKPGEGANLVCRFLTKDGTFTHLLTSSMGGIELWALSTTKEDTIIRDALYQEYGPKATRRLLASRFPGGTAKNEIEAREQKRSQSGVRSPLAVTDEVLAELRSFA